MNIKRSGITPLGAGTGQLQKHRTASSVLVEFADLLKDLHIYGPIGLEIQIMRIISSFGTGELKNNTFDIHIHEITQNTFSIGDHMFDFVNLPTINTCGLKFRYGNKTYAFTGDS